MISKSKYTDHKVHKDHEKTKELVNFVFIVVKCLSVFNLAMPDQL